MVAAVRGGESERSVARKYGVSLLTVQRWVGRAAGQRLDRVDWRDRPSGPHHASRRVSRDVEDLVLTLRHDLRAESDLGEFGADAIHAELVAGGITGMPCARTIHRILERRGALDSHRRMRHLPPPPGWYLPDVADGRAELDQFDVVEGLVIKNGPHIEVLTAVGLHSGLVGAWPQPGLKATTVREFLLEHWRECGLPQYAQFDNDTLFQGPHQHRDVVSSVMRLCLSLDITPVFVPPRELGFQAAIESFNGRWQAKVWGRFEHASLEALRDRSARYVAAYRQRTITRRDAAERRPFPDPWQLDLQVHPHGRIVFIRRTTEQGYVTFLGRTFLVDPLWIRRHVRCEVQLDEHHIGFYALRRRAPNEQPLLNEASYILPRRRFRG